jgi:predicted Holliday junction resolvase-like endonuclease
MSLALIVVLIVLAFIFGVLALCFAVQSINRHQDQTAQLLRQQWREDLRQNRESLLTYLPNSPGSKR